ncbi:hypothetical protein CCAX7_64850 [Capsulimonas corticalis]|uniref:Uncharacterized protein n=1 Tax=Capsulimonas corticalis TaxID=2219043 RepID=A0A402CQU4_9BACT|nr:hypothetical protein [Capsulimonas corticalis]BDI34434.1 hypothetical protein CCAX7_64850 [Capsulimonas corticalis]
MVTARDWPLTSFQQYGEEKAAIAKDWATASATLSENLPGLLAAIEGVSDEELALELQTPFGPMTMEQIISYPYWNMTYHQGQVTYVGILNEAS